MLPNAHVLLRRRPSNLKLTTGNSETTAGRVIGLRCAEQMVAKAVGRVARVVEATDGEVRVEHEVRDVLKL